MTTLDLSGRIALVSRTRAIDRPDDLLHHLGPDGFAWLGDDLAFVTSGTAAVIDARDAAGLAELCEVDDPVARRGTGVLAVGALPFRGAERRLVVPAVLVGRDTSGWWETRVRSANVAVPVRPAAPERAREPAPDRERWRVSVTEALTRIDRGELRKVVLARDTVVESPERSPFDVRRVLAALRATQPGCRVYAAGRFVGASPEVLVARDGLDVVSRPMAGTIARGARLDLLQSAKDREEHRIVVDAVVTALEGHCAGVSVGTTAPVRFADVSHLVTPVRGRLREPAPDAAALALALHPTPAVAGVPTAAALDLIAQLEGFDRGRYAGPVGWVDARGDGEFAVALRCAELDGARARLFAGAGIVAGSDPDAEWDETEAKLEPMRRALLS